MSMHLPPTEALAGIPDGHLDKTPTLFTGRFAMGRLFERIRYGRNLPTITKVAIGLVSGGEEVKRVVTSVQHPPDMPSVGPEGMLVGDRHSCREVIRDIDETHQLVLTDRIQPGINFGHVSAVKAAVYVRENGQLETDQLVTVFGPHSESTPQAEELLRMFISDL